MAKRLHIAFFWVAGLLLFAHSIVPHIHHESETELELCHDESDGDVLDFLAEMFHNDLGVEHLEHFQLSKSPIIIAVATANPIILPELKAEDGESVVVWADCDWAPDEPLLESLRLRGPPLV